MKETSPRDALLQLRAKIDELCGPREEDAPEDYWEARDIESLGESLYQSDKTFGDEGVQVILAAIEFVQSLGGTQEPKVRKLLFDEGGMNLQLEGGTARIFAASVVQLFKDNGGVNFVQFEVGVTDPDERENRYNLVVQKVGGESPAQKYSAVVEALRAWYAMHDPQQVELTNKWHNDQLRTALELTRKALNLGGEA